MKNRGRKDADSYVEIRMLLLVGTVVLGLALAIPALLHAADLNNDNLDDAWEAQYGITTNAYASTNLVGWWQMQPNSTNSVVDSSANQITGTLTNFPGSPFGPGLFSNALNFPATGQVNFPTNSAFDTATNQFTFSSWFQSTNGTGQPATIATWSDTSTNSWSVGVDSSGNAGVAFTDGSGNTQSVAPTSGSIQLYDGTWHHVAVTFDTNQLATVYVDGQNQASGTITNWAPTTTSAFTLGVPDISATNQIYALDDTRLYNRALAANEVDQLPVTYTDLNGSGLTVLDDYLEGLDPLATNVLVTPDFANSGLAAYYGTNLPTLTKTGGDGQVIAAGMFGMAALKINVTDALGNPLVGAPVTFAIQTGSDGGLSQTSSGATVVRISETTDADGNATVFYQADADVLRNNKIIATAVTQAGDVTACFKEHCGVQNGLASWLYADAGVTADGSENVSQWLDESANSNSAIQSSSGIQPQLVPGSLEGHSVIHFDGSSSYLLMPPCIADDFTMIVVFRSSMGSGAGPDWFGAGGIVDAETTGIVNDFGMSLDPQGDILTGVGNPDTSQSSTVGGYNDGRAHIATFTRTQSTADFSQYVDSVLQGTQNNGNTSSLNAPTQITIGATQTLANYFGGDVAEVLLYSRNLSTEEQAEIEGYLADKYGVYSANATWPSAYSSDVQAQITADQWNKAQADAYVAFSASPPVPAPGLLLWLTAGAGVSTDEDGNVQEWIDQSPSGHTVAQSTTISPPVLETDGEGNPCVSFDGTQALISTDYIPANNDLTIIAVETDQHPENFSMILTLGGLPNLNEGQTRSLCDCYGTQDFDLYYAGYSGGPPGQAGEQVVSTLTYQRSSGTAKFYIRGDFNGSGNVTANDLSSGLFIGDSADLGLPFNGTISSVMVYNRILSDAERGAVEGYLADQFGAFSTNATWPSSYAADLQALIFENEWTKAMTDAYIASMGDAVRAPIVSPPGGRFASSQTITVTSATSDATIYYTTDGSTPTESSPSISNGGTLTVDSSSQYKFLASNGSAPDSSITSAVYAIGANGSVAAGDSFTLFLKPDGTVYSVGDNGRGQEADNQAENPLPMPQQVSSLSGVTTIAAGGDHALAVTSDGSVWAWGADDQSQCGDGGTSDLLIPTQLTSLSGISSVAAAPFGGFAVDGSGNLYGWGLNDQGQLGDGTNDNETTPEAITSVSNVTKVAASPNFTLVLESDGSVWASGNNDNGVLGDGTTIPENFFQQVQGLSNVVDIAAGWKHALALCADGSVWSWGFGGDGELGHGNFNSSSYPQRILGLPAAVAVVAVDSKSYIVLVDGTIRCFGGDNEGELGLGAGISTSEPTPSSPAGVRDVTMLAAGTFHTVVGTSKGALYGWGDNTSFRLTQSFTNASYNSPTEVHDPLWQNVSKVVVVNSCTVALKSDGTVWSVGSNNAGSLGDGNWATVERPVQVQGLSSIATLAGGNMGMAIDSTGNLFVWGGNWDGQLGIGSGDWLNAPQQVSDVSNVIAAASGDNHSLIVESDGSVWAAGDDSHGELGDGGSDQEQSYIQVTALSDATLVAAGSNTSFVLESDGSVWAWGQNDSGQLGLGTTDDVATPTQITGLPAMVSIAAFQNNAMGIDSDGNVWSWGSMGNGDGTPLEQSGVSDVIAVAPGTAHELALQSDGTLWGLGANFNGQLGDPSYSEASSFTPFPDVSGATAVGAGYDTSFVVKQDGTLAGFGGCYYAQLGGNLGEYDSVPRRLYGFAMNETPPSVSLTSPTSSDSGTENTALSFQASASASTGSISRVDYYLNGVRLGTSTTPGTWDFSWTSTTYGDLTFEAVAIDTAGVGTVSSPVTINVAYSAGSPPTPPSSPTNVTVTAGPPGTVYIGWTNGSGASSILIQQQNTDGSWTTVDTISDSSVTSDTVTGLTPGQDYNFRVVESNTSGTASGSGSYSASSPNAPVLTKQGDEQAVAASSFASNPLVVQVNDTAGNPLSGVSVAFGLGTGSDGGLALSNGGSTASTQTVTTDALGHAAVYYEAGDDTLKNNIVTASAASGSGNVTVNFTECCGISSGLSIWLDSGVGVTADGSGDVSAWADQSPGQHVTTQTTGTNQPQLVTDSETGEAALNFSGNQWLSTSDSIPANNDVTIIALANADDTTAWSNIASLGTNPTSGGTIRGLAYRDSEMVFDIYQNSSETGSVPDSGVSAIAEVTYQRSSGNVAFYLNGEADGTASISVADLTSGFVVGAPGFFSNKWSGTISEVLVYNRVLTSDERQDAEIYLADKYGVYDADADWPLAYSSDVQAQITAHHWNRHQADAYVSFLASSAPVPAAGLSLWLKADAGVTTDGSGNVTGWADQSFNGNNAGGGSGGVTVISSGTDGKPMIHFGGSNYLVIRDAASLRPSRLTILAVAKENTTDTYQTMLARGYRNSSGWGYPYVSWCDCLFGVNGGNYLRTATTTGGSLTENNASNTYDISKPHVFGFIYDGSAQQVFLEGTMTASTATSGDLDYGGGHADLSIGSRSAASPAEYLHGDVSEILVYDHALNSDELSQAEGYLADTYGLYDAYATWPLAYSSDVQALITANHWDKAHADAYEAYIDTGHPFPTDDLVSWMDADTGVTTGGSGNVSAWMDQTVHDNNGTQSNGSVQPTRVTNAIGSHAVVHFNGSGQYLAMPRPVSDDFTITVVFRSTTTSGGGGGWYNSGGMVDGEVGGVVNDFGISLDGSGQLLSGTGNPDTTINGNGGFNDGQPHYVTFTRTESTGALAQYVDSALQGTATGGTQTLDSPPRLTIGATQTGTGYYYGDIAEIMIYSKVLSSGEQEEEEGYLADKYGIYSPDATWPSAYSSDVQAEIARNRWTKVQADNYVSLQSSNPDMLTTGLKLWLKADSGVNQDGSGNVNSWTDQTGNYTVSQSGGTRPTYVSSDVNGKPALHFNGGQTLYNPSGMGPGINSDMTMIAVCSSYNPGAQQYTIYLGNTGGYANRGLGYYASRQLFDLSNGNYSLGTGTPPPGNFVTEEWTLGSDLSSVAFYRNGYATGTASMGSVQNVTNGITIGGYNGYGTPWQGDIAEVLVYDHQLSNDESDEVYGYLADKYGFYNPNASWPLAYSSDVQAEITRNQWTKAQADNYVALQSANPDMLTSGLLLWLKADAGVTADGSGNVSAWADQTGDFNLSQGNISYSPTLITSDINGKPALRFNGSQWLHDSNSIGSGANADVTMIMVASTSSPGAQQYGVWLGATGTGYNRGLGYYSWSQIFDTYNIWIGGGGAPAANNFVVEAATLSSDRSTMTLYENGSSTATNNSISGIQNIQPGVSVGTLYGAGYNWQGDISEVLVYDHQLSSDDLQTVGVYLADKYGLYNPNATWPLAYSSDVQAQITANQWNKAQADAYVAFLATLAAWEAAHPDMVTDGLTVWLEADNSVTTGSGDAVSQWADQTPYANNANQGTSGYQPNLVSNVLNGKPVVRFNGGNFLDITDNNSIKPASGVTVIAVAQASGGGYQDIVAKGLTHGHWGWATDPPYYAYTLGTGSNDVEHAYVATNPDENGNDLYSPLGQYHGATIRTLVFDGNATTPVENIYAAGSLLAQMNAAGATLDYQDGSQRDLLLGATVSYTGIGNFFTGDIAEVFVYNRALTGAEQQEVEVYLADKYGLYHPDATWPLTYSSDVQALITTNNWSKAQADAYVAFAATNTDVPSSGLSVWLKSDTGVTADGSGYVSQWADQSIFKNNAVQTTSANQPSLIASALNGKPVIRFSGGQFLDIKENATLRPNSGVTVIALAQTTSTGYQDIIAKALTHGHWPGYNDPPYFSYDLGTGNYDIDHAYTATNPGENANDLYGSVNHGYRQTIRTLVFDGTATTPVQSIYAAGILQAQANTTGAVLDYQDANERDLLIGAAGFYAGIGNYFTGDLAEVLVYNRALSSAEQEQAEVYLADKFGVYHSDATWPLAYSSDVQALITTNQWSKTEADDYVTLAAANPDMPTAGLSVWLEADSGVTTDVSGKVSQWADQSVYHNDARQSTSSNQPTLVSSALNGKPILQFDGSSSFMAVKDDPSLRASSGVTVVVVAQALGAGYQDIVSKYLTHTTWGWDWNSPFYTYQLGTGNNDTGRAYMTTSSGPTGHDLYAPVSQEHQFVLRAMVYDGTSQSLYHSGQLDSTQSVSGSIYNDNTAERDLWIGASGATPGGTVNFLNGNVAEVLVYNHALTSTDLDQAQVYLADKYGVYHPDATWPLAYSSDVQAEIAANQWTKAQADAFVTYESSSPPVTSDGLSLWLKADSGVTADGGGHISQWSDQSMNHNDANQGTSGNQPTLVSNVINGNPVVRFNGSSNFFDVAESASLRPATGITILAVAQTHGGGYQDIVAQSLTHTTWGWDWNAPYYSYELGTGPNDVERGYTTASSSATANDLYARVSDGGQMDVMTMIYDGPNQVQSLYRRGIAQNWLGVDSPLNYQDSARRDLYLGASGSTPGGTVNYLNGDVAEVLIYNRALSDEERAEAEGYLADKYGLYAPSATWPLAYSTEVQAEITLNQWSQTEADNYVTLESDNPTLLTHGLVLWLKADSGVTADGSGNVSAWADQSGNYTVVQTTSANQPTLVANDINGQSAIRFSGSQSLSQAVQIGAGINHDLTMVAVQTSSNPSSFQDSLYFGTGSSGQSRGMGYANSTQYADFSSLLGTESGGPAPVANTFVTDGVSLDSSLQKVTFFRDGVASGAATVTSLQNVANGLFVGNRSDGAAPWQGDIAELLVFNHQLTESEMHQVGGYLGDKYGIYNPNATWFSSYSSDVQARIAAYQWTKAQADAWVAAHSGTPTMVSSGLALWLEADAGITHDGSGNISSWADQTGTYTLTQTGTAEPTYISSDINGKPALRLNGSQYLASTGTLSGVNADCTILTVASSSSPSSQQYSLYAGSGSGSGYANRAIGYSSSQEFYDTAGSATTSGQAPSPNTFVTEAATLDSGLTNITFYQNGNQTGSGTLSGLQNVSAGIAVGAAPTPGNYWQGDIAEVIVYDHKLSDSDLQQVDGYLADKYGLFDPNATWPSAYSEAVEIEILKHQWNKAQADNYVAMQSANPTMLTDGLTLWLRADSGVTKDGSNNVSAIADQTGNYNLSQSTSGSQPLYVASDLNGNPAIRFNGSQWLGNATAGVSGISHDMTVITVASTTALTAQEYALYLGPNNGTPGINRATGYYGSELFDTMGSDSLGGLPPSSGTFVVETTTLDSTLANVTFYQNGLQSGIGTVSGLQNPSPGITLGAATGPACGWQGDIAEVLVYDHQLSSTEMQQVGLYLANKYGLYSNSPPVISPNGGSFTGSQSVTITAGITAGAIHYTLDGTEPTADSPTYTSAISLTSSALVSAAVFVDGEPATPVATAQFYINDSGHTGLPPAPTGLTVTPISSTDIGLSWTLGSLPTYSAIYVYRSTNGGGYELIAVLDPTATGYFDKTVSDGNTYTYKIGTVNQAGVASTAPSSSTSPTTPTDFSIVLTTPSGAVPLP